ncbi:sulfotransferase family protein [Oceanicoccus sagamiensis]|uniref:Sulfotransferase domain-containing protein n=1 Tax=Oceanicoccus sagamiensis TaxID=716816 RepID=A0A1X9NGL4_9GAMM|nr:sulfotransferase [Oceanicoccus sagamiensis]ARN74087.1 hypothetical protein BST96_08105 [Oceanicoccus sagamiensis]
MNLPNFIIIGAAKAGTTALYHYLGAHPAVFMSPIKETNYFAWEEALSLSDRKHLFPVSNIDDYTQLFESSANATAIGEASPLYLESPIAAYNIHQQIPKAKLIVSLRNPVERAISGYLMHVRSGKINLDLNHQFTADEHYVNAGFYHENLNRFYDLFPRENIHVSLYETFNKNPEKIINDLYSFVDVDTNFQPDLREKHNIGQVPKNPTLNKWLRNRKLKQLAQDYFPGFLKKAGKFILNKNMSARPDFSRETKLKLLELYKQDIEKTQQLTGLDLSQWLHFN